MTSKLTTDSTAAEEDARPSTPADVDAIVELAAALRVHTADQRGGPLWALHDALPASDREYFLARLDDPDVATYVGTLDGHVLGYALAHTEPVATQGLLGVIDELFVTEPARAVGLGETVLSALVAWCTDAGCFGIDATALPGDRHAKNFFESAGFKARRLIMHTDLR